MLNADSSRNADWQPFRVHHCHTHTNLCELENKNAFDHFGADRRSRARTRAHARGPAEDAEKGAGAKGADAD